MAAGGIALAGKALASLPGEAAVVETAAVLLRLLLTACDGLAFYQLDCVPQLVAMVSARRDDARLFQLACAALAAATATSAGCVAGTGGVGQTIAGLQQHFDNPSASRAALHLLTCLGQSGAAACLPTVALTRGAAAGTG